LFLFVASDIDSRGQIVGWGVETSTGETHAFLATPSNDEPVSGDGTLAAQGASFQRMNGVLPENVREQLRQGLGFRRFLGSPQTIALTSTAMISGPNATLSPTSLAFSTLGIGTTSAAKVVTLSNNGTASLSISSIAITGANAGDFAQTHNLWKFIGTGRELQHQADLQAHGQRDPYRGIGRCR
jgi:probable HAF family extracellular repeat protein